MPDYIDILEAAYRVEADEESWLAGLCAALAPALDRGLGLWAVLYDVSEPARARVGRIVSQGAASGVLSGLCTRALVEARTGGATLTRQTCTLLGETKAPAVGRVLAELRANGIEDVLGIEAGDPSGAGVFVAVNLPRGARPGHDELALYGRLAAHASTACRLRRRLASAPAGVAAALAGADAVLDPRGRVADAAPAASSTAARRKLREATLALERARGRLRRTAPAQAVGEWKGLVAARWTLLDHFDRDGRRYVIARRNDPVTPDFERLTERERQVVAFASLGHQNKLIAYELGLATSTVGVLLSRAFAKLGLKDRTQLVAAFRAWCARRGRDQR